VLCGSLCGVLDKSSTRSTSHTNDFPWERSRSKPHTCIPKEGQGGREVFNASQLRVKGGRSRTPAATRSGQGRRTSVRTSQEGNVPETESWHIGRTPSQPETESCSQAILWYREEVGGGGVPLRPKAMQTLPGTLLGREQHRGTCESTDTLVRWERVGLPAYRLAERDADDARVPLLGREQHRGTCESTDCC